MLLRVPIPSWTWVAAVLPGTCTPAGRAAGSGSGWTRLRQSSHGTESRFSSPAESGLRPGKKERKKVVYFRLLRSVASPTYLGDSSFMGKLRLFIVRQIPGG